ncbi:MAG: ATP-binding protein [Steroidobacteraceae bacterium]
MAAPVTPDGVIAQDEFLRREAQRVDRELFMLRFSNWRVSLCGLVGIVWTIAAMYRYLEPAAETVLWASVDTAIFATIAVLCFIYERRPQTEISDREHNAWIHMWTLPSCCAGAFTGLLPWFLPAGRVELQLSAGILVSIAMFAFVASRTNRLLINCTVAAYTVALCIGIGWHGGLVWAVPLVIAYTGVVLTFVLTLTASMRAALGRQLYAEYLHVQLQRAHARQLQVQQRESALNERQRMMADLNEGLGAQMTGALRRLESGERDAGVAANCLRECVADLQLTVDAHEPAARSLATLLSMLRNRLQPRLQTAGVNLQWRVYDLPPGATIPAPHSLDLLRILQQAVENVVQHASAREVAVTSLRLARQLEISVEDDGTGFDPATVMHRGSGIASMQRRAARLGAELFIEPRDGGGSALRLRLKLPFGEPADGTATAARRA